MNALLTALLLAAAPDIPTTTTPVSVEKPTPRAAVWVQPVGTVLFGLFGQAMYLPLGVNVPLAEKTSLALELTPVVGSWRSSYDTFGSDKGLHWRVLAAVGPVFSFGQGSLSGPFIEPKLMTVLAYDPDYAYDEVRIKGGVSFELQAGLDVGWQFSAGGWYFTPMLGASAGYCLNCSGDSKDFVSALITPMAREYSAQRGPRPVLNVNLNLLRIGTAF
jgi:hypothetical protein